MTESPDASGRSRRPYLPLSRRSVRVLSALALACLVAWPVVRNGVASGSGGLAMAAGLAGLVGMVLCAVLFLSTYAFVANAPAGQIDERELQQRNAAYVWSYQAVAALILAALIFNELSLLLGGPRFDAEQFGQMLTVLFFLMMVLPAAVLAWRDAPAED